MEQAAAGMAIAARRLAAAGGGARGGDRDADGFGVRRQLLEGGVRQEVAGQLPGEEAVERRLSLNAPMTQSRQGHRWLSPSDW